ncbi:MAG: hypothetical protein AAGA29_03235 [Planctomycetota bacterium]
MAESPNKGEVPDDEHKQGSTHNGAIDELIEVDLADLLPDRHHDFRRGSSWITGFAIAMIYLLGTASNDSVFAAIDPFWRKIEITCFFAALAVQASFLLWHRSSMVGLAHDAIATRTGRVAHLIWFHRFVNSKIDMQAAEKKAEIRYASSYLSHSFLSDMAALFFALSGTMLVALTWW